MDQQKKEKFRIIHKRLFVGLVAVLIVVIIVSSVISVAFLYVPPYTLQNSSREFTFTTNTSKLTGTGPFNSYYYVNRNISSIAYLNQSKPSIFEISLNYTRMYLRQGFTNPPIGNTLIRPETLFYCYGSTVSVRGHILDNLHPTGIQFHFYLLSDGGRNGSTYIIKKNYTYGYTSYDSVYDSVNNLSIPKYNQYFSYQPGGEPKFSAPIVIDLTTKNVTHFNFFSDNYYNFELTTFVGFTFNATRNLSSVQGQNFELCANLLGLGKKVTSSVEVKIRVSPLVYITEVSAYTPYNVENDVTKAVCAINGTSRTLPLEPYTNYTAFFYLNGTKEQYNFNSGPPFQERILNANTVRPYFEWE